MTVQTKVISVGEILISHRLQSALIESLFHVAVISNKMHRFKLIQKGTTKSENGENMRVYALMNGTYDGGNDYDISKSGIQCAIDTSVGKFFRLVVKDDDVKLTAISNAQNQSLSLTLKHGDVFEIGRDRFELVKHERNVNRSDNCSGGFPCFHHEHSMDERKASDRVDCQYPDCFFACWCIADLNEHITSDDGHKGQLLPRNVSSSLFVRYSSL